MPPVFYLWLLCLSSFVGAWEWEQINVGGGPSARFGASACDYVSGPLICGGEAFSGPLSDCFVLAPTPWRWQQSLPPGRVSGHSLLTSVVSNGDAFLYGGNTTQVGPDAAKPIILNIGPWVPLSAVFSNVPVARYGHSSVLVEDPTLGPLWVIFGGASLDDGSDLQDVAVLPLGTASSLSFAWLAPTTRGALQPGPRRFHSASVSGSQMFVYGGISGTSVLSDLYILGVTGEFQWAWLYQPTARSYPLYNHRSVVVAGALLVVGGLTTGGAPTPALATGGVALLDVDSWTWSSPEVDGSAPSGFSLPAVALVYPAEGSEDGLQLALFGGAVDDAGGAVSQSLFVLSGIEPPAAASKTNIVPILAGCITGSFVLIIILVLTWWQRRMLCKGRVGGGSAGAAGSSTAYRQQQTGGASYRAIGGGLGSPGGGGVGLGYPTGKPSVAPVAPPPSGGSKRTIEKVAAKRAPQSMFALMEEQAGLTTDDEGMMSEDETRLRFG